MKTIATMTFEEAGRIADRLEDLAAELRDTPQDFALVLTEGSDGAEHLDLEVEAEALVGDDSILITLSARRSFDGRTLIQ